MTAKTDFMVESSPFWGVMASPLSWEMEGMVRHVKMPSTSTGRMATTGMSFRPTVFTRATAKRGLTVTPAVPATAKRASETVSLSRGTTCPTPPCPWGWNMALPSPHSPTKKRAVP